MLSYEAAGDVLDSLCEELPAEFFEDLSAGVVLCHESKPHPELPLGGHWILGEYVRDRTLGNGVRVYYGSIFNVLGAANDDVWVAKLREVLRHEFRHHVEGRAGVRDLEILDEIYLAEAKTRVGGVQS